MRILLIEDDKKLGQAIYEGLKEEYSCDWMLNAEDAELALEDIDYDIIVLDINLPGMSGLDLLSNIRKAANTIPVLILTAQDATHQRVEGLDRGADDYLVKPFDFEELLARIRALLRRKGSYKNVTLEYGDISLDYLAKAVTQAGRSVRCSLKEFDILYLLMDNAGRCLSRQQIEEKIYDWNDDFESNTVEVHISSIRRKLGKELIKTIRGVGYIIERRP